MEIMVIGIIFIVVGLIFAIIGLIGFLIKAFSESFLWGIGVLIIPFVWIIYLVLFEEGRSSFVKVLISIPFFLLGLVLMEGAY
ncbi:MAG: hypothetical protein H8E55_46410 [Pelagibacterales bacterium]|nr:hypothetical protein [Pelagibacterales bacterium]